jgi:hypothetical protein
MHGDVDAGIEELLDALSSDQEHPFGDEQAWMARISLLTSAVQLGDVELGTRAISGAEALVEDDTVGIGDRIAALAMHHLQRSDLDAAERVMAHGTEDRGYLHSARALVAAARGELEAVLAEVDAIERHPHTYLDRAYGGVARAIALAGDDRIDEARTVAAEVIADVDATGDRLAQAVARLVDAHLAELGRRGDASTARTVAESRLADLGVAADGWRQLLRGALRAVPAA